jgi:hypothetical protein
MIFRSEGQLALRNDSHGALGCVPLLSDIVNRQEKTTTGGKNLARGDFSPPLAFVILVEEVENLLTTVVEGCRRRTESNRGDTRLSEVET